MYIFNHIFVGTTPWSTFQDYGYQLPPDFAQVFDLEKPLDLVNYICPVGLAKPPSSISHYTHPLFSRYETSVSIDDKIVVGLDELMNVADQENLDDILVTGKMQDGKYVQLDLLKDGEKDVPLLYSCDIDSFIYVTQKPKFTGPVAIYMMLVI